MKKILFVLVLLGLFVAGCSQQYAPAVQPNGNLVLKLTDAPAALNSSKAIVTISKVQIHVGSEAPAEANATNTTANETAEAGWITVAEGPQDFDLVQLKNVTAVLGETSLPKGRYTQVRLTVDKALVTIDGTEHTLEIPSKTVKLVRGFSIEANKTTTLTLDFVAEDSIREAGKGKYMMTPTIKIVEE